MNETPNASTPSMPLRAWLDQAWDEHEDAPWRVARGVIERAAALPDDEDGAEAVRLAEHVLLAHLAEPAALQALEALLAALPPGEALAGAAERARWALAMLAGAPAPALADGVRWRALHDVVMARVLQGRIDEARTLLFADEAAALAHPEAKARQGYAATANNTALGLRLGPRGDAARDALMLEAAQLARRAWAAAGTWLHIERADYQLALCHAALGQGAAAVAHAEACLAACEAHGADAAERFFAHECAFHAQRAAGDEAAAAAHRAQMAALLAQIEDASMRGWCESTLAKIA